MARVQASDFVVVDAHGDSNVITSSPGEVRIDMLLGRLDNLSLCKPENCGNLVFTNPQSIDDLIVLLQAHRLQAWPEDPA